MEFRTFRFTAAVCSTILALSAVSFSAASENQNTSGDPAVVTKDAPDATVDPNETETGKVEAIAKDYGITADSVEHLKTAYSIGYGGVSKALALAKKSGLSVDAIMQMKTEEKLGWGQIAKKLELEPGKDYKAEAAVDAKEKRRERMENRSERRTEQMEKKGDREKGPKNR